MNQPLTWQPMYKATCFPRHTLVRNGWKIVTVLTMCSGILISTLWLETLSPVTPRNQSGFDSSVDQFDEDTVGPIVGHVTSRDARLLYRPGEIECTLRLSVLDQENNVVSISDARCTEENDFVAHFHAENLSANSEYRYRIERVDGKKTELLLGEAEKHFFRTVSDAREGKAVSIAFVSCVDEKPNGIWPEMEKLNIDTLFLMGDTPYIDSSDLGVVRTKHRNFLRLPDVAALASHIPTVGVWDDHDFGRNNGNGLNMAKGKSKTRQGFVEYRAHSQYGNGNEGVYHNVDLGMIEVFLLDPRYFSQTEASPAMKSQTTCFGAEQWNWLLENLKASQAPFKVLSMGAIWQDKKNSETDDMFTYWYERDALLDFIDDNQISGVVLLGGDIHVARHLVHPQRVSYDLHDFVISPGHDRTIKELDVYHPSLEWSLVEGHQFLTVKADGTGSTPQLIVQYRQPDGKVNREVVLDLDDLTPKREGGLRSRLRGHWTFDRDFTNHSRLGSRIDATANNGASIDQQAGINRGALKLIRKRQQYLNVPRSFLDDNSDEHTISMWIKPTTLPTHGTNERHFLLESSAEGKPSNKNAYHLSLGFRSANDPDRINLQMYTHTLQPPEQQGHAPSAISQGGFSHSVDRALFEDWTQVAIVFDSNEWKIYLNGKESIKHPIPIPGPASEFGGLIIGGHRAGQGRNFDGLIDELAVWARTLTDQEIAELHGNGNPPELSKSTTGDNK